MRKPLIFISLVLTLFIVYRSYSSSLAQNPSVDLNVYLPNITKAEPLRWLGPDGGNIVSLAISPQNPQIMYVGTWGAGVFKSSNGGASWTGAGLDNLFINALAVDPQNPDVVYAGPYREKLYKSVNGGQSWTFAGVGIQEQAIAYSIAIDPTNSNRVYISTRGISSSSNNVSYWNGRVYRSTDGGATWSETLTNVDGDPENQDDWAYSLAINPKEPFRVFAAMHLNGVYSSDDFGVSWTPVNNGIYDPSGRSVIINPISPNILYYGVWHRSCVFKSDNGATSWTHQDNGCGLPSIYNMALHPLQPDSVYLATFNFQGVLKTINGGITWFSSGLSQDQIYTVGVDAMNTSIVFAGTKGDGLFRSINGGSTWSRYQSGINNATVPSFLVQPDANKSIYAVVPGAGISRLLAPGQAWQDYNLYLPNRDVLGLARNPANPNILFAYTNSSGLFRNDTSTNNGWLPVTGPLPSADIPPTIYTPDHPFASREDLEAEVDVFPQVGQKDALLPSAYAPLTSMAFSLSNPNMAYLTSFTVDQVHAGVYRSWDSGMTWEPAGLDNTSAVALAISPQNPGVVYVATNTAGVVFYTANYGLNWQETYLPGVYIYTLAFSPLDSSQVYAGTDNGVFIRVGEGSWTQLGLGGIPVTALAGDPARPGRLYAGTTQGVYATYNGGLNWSPTYNEMNQDTIQSIGFDPVDSHWVYFGTKARGIVRAYFP